MLKIRRPLGRLIFNMGIAIPGKTVFLIETAPRSHAAFLRFVLVAYFCNLVLDFQPIQGQFSFRQHLNLQIIWIYVDRCSRFIAHSGLGRLDKSSSSRLYMMTSSSGNIYRVTGPLCGEFTGHTPLPQRPEGARTLTGKQICNFRPWTC